MALPTPGVTPANWGAQLNTELNATFDRVVAKPSTQSADYNTKTLSGWYVMDSTAANGPFGATMYLEVRALSTTYVEQVARGLTTYREYRRTMQNSVWQPWQRTNSVLHRFDQTGQSASIGDITYGLSPALGNLSGRNIRLTIEGTYDPAGQSTGIVFDFYRAIDGAAGVNIGFSFYDVAVQDWTTGFTYTWVDVPPAGSAVYYVRARAHYLNGQVIGDSRFTIEDVGPV